MAETRNETTEESSARVLVVEDSPDQARLIAGLLEAGGFTPEITATAEAAIEALAQSTPDIVATDLILPGLSGLDVVEEVKRSHPLVPVILMTAFGNGEIAARALEKGAASYVPKRRIHDELVPTIDPSLIPPLAAFVQEWIGCHAQPIDETERMHVGIALHEALVNAMHHGNLEIGSKERETGGDLYRDLVENRRNRSPYRDRRVRVTLKLSLTELVCVIRDEGPGFTPQDVPDPTDPENLERVGGRGLYLIWAFMDRVEHNTTGNEITLIKQLVKSA